MTVPILSILKFHYFSTIFDGYRDLALCPFCYKALLAFALNCTFETSATETCESMLVQVETVCHLHQSCQCATLEWYNDMGVAAGWAMAYPKFGLGGPQCIWPRQ